MTMMTAEKLGRAEAPACTGDSFPEALKAVLPRIKDLARETERNRRVPAESIEALRRIGLFDMVRPREFGGQERPFRELVDATIQIAGACANTGWVAGLLSAHQWLLAMFPLQAQHDVWDADPDALLCGSYAPIQMAERVEGGFRLSGRWSFASGCDNAQWALCAALLPGAEGQRPVPAFLLVPQSQYVIDDTWDVVGLAGTGSKTLLLDGVVVPEHRVLTFPAATSGNTPGAASYPDRPVFNIPLLSGIASCLAGTAVGAAIGALEDYIASVNGRVTRGAVAGGNNRMAEFPTIQLRLAEAIASSDAARTILLRDQDENFDILLSGGRIDVDRRIKTRRGQAFAVMMSIRAVEALNASTGGLGLDLSNPVQRAWRDANAVGRHISMNWDTVGTLVGQHAFGLELKGQY